jgi:hypothetical protein
MSCLLWGSAIGTFATLSSFTQGSSNVLSWSLPSPPNLNCEHLMGSYYVFSIILIIPVSPQPSTGAVRRRQEDGSDTVSQFHMTAYIIGLMGINLGCNSPGCSITQSSTGCAPEGRMLHSHIYYFAHLIHLTDSRICYRPLLPIAPLFHHLCHF